MEAKWQTSECPCKSSLIWVGKVCSCMPVPILRILRYSLSMSLIKLIKGKIIMQIISLTTGQSQPLVKVIVGVSSNKLEVLGLIPIRIRPLFCQYCAQFEYRGASMHHPTLAFYSCVRGGRVVRRCWVNFQCWGVLLIWMIVGQGPIALAVGAGGGCLDIFFSRLSFLFSFSLSGGGSDID